MPNLRRKAPGIPQALQGKSQKIWKGSNIAHASETVEMELHAEMAMSAALPTAMTHLRANDYERMRHMTIKL